MVHGGYHRGVSVIKRVAVFSVCLLGCAPADDGVHTSVPEARQMPTSQSAGRRSAYENEARREQLLKEQYQFDVKMLSDSCTDIAQLAEHAQAIRADEETRTDGKTYDALIVSQYETLLEERRASGMRSITTKIDSITKKRLSLMDVEDPASARVDIEPTRNLVSELVCYDAGAAAAKKDEVDGWARELDENVSIEISCRASPKCMGGRLAKPICDALSDKRAAQQGIAEERRNPSGVVDLRALHDLGERIQDDDATIADLERKYASMTRQSFSANACK